jgi:hypothetical protein
MRLTALLGAPPTRAPYLLHVAMSTEMRFDFFNTPIGVSFDLEGPCTVQDVFMTIRHPNEFVQSHF